MLTLTAEAVTKWRHVVITVMLLDNQAVLNLVLRHDLLEDDGH